MVELAEVRTAFGRELAWQSTQEVGWGRFAVVKDAWKRAGVIPSRFVAQVADMVGYESEAAFSRAFKKAVGLAPATWRRSHS